MKIKIMQAKHNPATSRFNIKEKLVIKGENMKSVVKKGLYLLAAVLLFSCALSAGVLAEEKSGTGQGLINLESIQLNGGSEDLATIEAVDAEMIKTTAVAGDYEYYSYPKGGVEITKYTGSGEKVTIPDVINGETVLWISGYAFSGCNNIVEIIIPNGVETVYGGAFTNCANLTKISLPKSLKYRKTDGNPISDCDKLTEIQIDPANTNFKVVNGLLLNYSGDALVGCPSWKTSVNIPEGVTNIGRSAFLGCDKLQTIQLPSTLQTIAQFAFKNCSGITNITIPDNTTRIGIGAFVYCDKLENVSFGKRLTEINSFAFADCIGLKEVTLPASLTSINEEGLGVFSRCPQLAKVVIPETMTVIQKEIFTDSPLVNIYGKTNSYAQTYASRFNIPFIPLDLLSVESFTTDMPSGQKINTSIKLTAVGTEGKTPYQYKFSYQLNGTDTTLQDFGSVNTATFTPTVAGDYTLIVEVKDAAGNTETKSKAMHITDGTTAEAAFLSFIGKDSSGDFYKYPVEDINNAYLAYQIKPELAAAKMYQQFLNSKCGIVALEDAAKGYLDYNAAANASLLAQMKGESFDVLVYFARDDAKLFEEIITDLKNVDKEGNVN